MFSRPYGGGMPSSPFGYVELKVRCDERGAVEVE